VRGAMMSMALSVLAWGCRGTAPPPLASELVREGARPTAVRTGNIDGDVEKEAVVASVSAPSGETGIPRPYVEVFDLQDGDWRRVFDARGPVPPGPPSAPPRMLEEDKGFVAQSVHVVELVDFEGDRMAEIVVGIASAGATAGPLELWILKAGGHGALRTEFYESTERGGRVTVEGDRLRFEFPVYRAGDPGCCPSRFETQRIGHDRTSGRIGILERGREKL
jgi:hypothetical protein